MSEFDKYPTSFEELPDDIKTCALTVSDFILQRRENKLGYSAANPMLELRTERVITDFHRELDELSEDRTRGLLLGLCTLASQFDIPSDDVAKSIGFTMFFWESSSK